MANKPELLGLVLCGGESRRMGRDKSWIRYHDSPQSVHAFNLVRAVCGEARVSVHKGQAVPSALQEFLLEDELEGIGPAGGILSAHRRYPGLAFLAVACDMPFLGHADLEELLENRGGDAAAFRTERIEPLAAIWEPSALAELERNVARGELSLRHTLERIDCRLLQARRESNLRNINSPRDDAFRGLFLSKP